MKGYGLFLKAHEIAGVVELADTPDLGSDAVRHASSTLATRTNIITTTERPYTLWLRTSRKVNWTHGGSNPLGRTKHRL